MTEDLKDILISWGPMLILIAVWIFFMLRMQKAKNQTDAVNENSSSDNENNEKSQNNTVERS